MHMIYEASTGTPGVIPSSRDDLQQVQRDALSIIGALPKFAQVGYTERAIAAESGVPKTTVRRFISYPHIEKLDIEQIMYLRKLASTRPGTTWTAKLVGSRYVGILSTAVPVGGIDGTTYWIADTSLYGVMVEVGARFEWEVRIDPRLGQPMARKMPYAWGIDHDLEGYA